MVRRRISFWVSVSAYFNVRTVTLPGSLFLGENIATWTKGKWLGQYSYPMEHLGMHGLWTFSVSWLKVLQFCRRASRFRKTQLFLEKSAVCVLYSLLGTKKSILKNHLKMIFLFQKWDDMLEGKPVFCFRCFLGGKTMFYITKPQNPPSWAFLKKKVEVLKGTPTHPKNGLQKFGEWNYHPENWHDNGKSLF